MNLSKTEQQRLKTKYGTWALVTGASSGIGAEIAEKLAQSGLNLFLVARRKSILLETANRFEQQYGIKTMILEADLSKKEGIEAVVNHSEILDIGLLVASAGFGTSGDFLDSQLANELEMIQVNCSALFALTHHFSKVFAKNRKGGIILLSSLVSFQGVPYSANYAATKAYVQSLAEGLYWELKPFNVDVLAAAPGPVLTEFGKRANMKMDLFLKASDIGVPILKALGRKQTILPGFLTKFLSFSLSFVPRWAKVRIMQIVMGGMTKHQRKIST